MLLEGLHRYGTPLKAEDADVIRFTRESFAEYAELCGALGIRVERADELDGALERALAHDGPSMVEVVADAELV